MYIFVRSTGENRCSIHFNDERATLILDSVDSIFSIDPAVFFTQPPYPPRLKIQRWDGFSHASVLGTV